MRWDWGDGGGFWCAGLEEREGDPCAVLEVVEEVQGAELKVMEGIRENRWKKIEGISVSWEIRDGGGAKNQAGGDGAGPLSLAVGGARAERGAMEGAEGARL